jgi:hypothetical protein
VNIARILRFTGFVFLAAALLPVVPQPVQAQEEPTGVAGERYQTTLFGQKIDVPPRDRRSVTAANLGVMWIPNGPSQLEVLPFGSLFVWRNWDDDRRRLRGAFAGLFNDINFNIGSRWLKGWELLLTFDNIIIPVGRAEYVEGQRIAEVEVEWNKLYGGVGVAYRTGLTPWYQDNAIEISLTYEPGYIWFKGKKEASPQFKVPNDTYEGRIRLRLRADGLVRNLMELPHRGFSFGGDLVYAHRSRWDDWGGVAFDDPDVQKERNYLSAAGYAVAAGGVPFVDSERHRLVASLYGGIGKGLDRFSTFRLPGRPTGYEWEALSLPLMPGAAFNELFPRRYLTTALTYRYEALFFLYPYIRGTWALVERPRFADGGAIRMKMDQLPSIGGGFVTAAPWRSEVEFNYAYNFGMIRDPGGERQFGSHGFFLFWAKLL